MRLLVLFLLLFLFPVSRFYSQGKDCRMDYFAYAPVNNNASIGRGEYNYWATGAAPGDGTAYSLASPSSSEPLIHNVTYNTGEVDHLSSSVNTFSGISCGDGYSPTIVHPKDNPILSSPAINCDSLYDVPNNYLFYNSKIAYDTGKFYIEHCYDQPNSYHIFGTIYDACSQLEYPDRDTEWANLRAWLKSVAYLNSSQVYYCNDLNDYARTFSHKDELGHPMDFKTAISIYEFLSDSLKCFGHSLVSDYINEYHNYWKDTVKDSTKTPFDSSTYTLDQMGQGFIRGFENQNSVTAIEPISSNLIADFSAVQNPFSDEVELHYKLNRENLTRLEIYDVLGREIWSDGQGYHSPGTAPSIKIDTKSWQAGTYYARLTTFSNETKTIVLKLLR
jgi:hypothetical protein